MKELAGGVLFVIAMFGLLFWMSTHTWSCRPDQKGLMRTDSNSKMITFCDGEHWVPYRLPEGTK